jgi:hypothetical protein
MFYSSYDGFWRAPASVSSSVTTMCGAIPVSSAGGEETAIAVAGITGPLGSSVAQSTPNLEAVTASVVALAATSIAILGVMVARRRRGRAIEEVEDEEEVEGWNF